MGAASCWSFGRFAPRGIALQVGFGQARITGHREAVTFVLARGMIPPSNHYDDLENTYVVFLLSPVGLLHPSLWGFSSSSYPSSPR